MRARVDWAAARARIAAAEAALDQQEPRGAQLEALLAQRAAALAPPPAAPTPADVFEALVFRLGDEQFALASSAVREVRVPTGLRKLPGAPAFVAGVLNVRGRVVTVLDLRPPLGLPASGAAAAVVLVPTPRGDVGLLTTERPALRQLRATELTDLPAGAAAGLDPGWVRGVTPDLVVVLDEARILADRRLLVEDGP